MRKMESSLEQMMPLILEQLDTGGTVRFTPHGTSMQPMLINGRDQVELSRVTGRLKKYDLPLYRRDNGQFVLHRIVRVGEHYTCIGDNQYILEYPVRQEQLLAVVTGFVRDGKYYAVRQFSYKLYCRLWHWSRPVRHLYLRGAGWLKRNVFKK